MLKTLFVNRPLMVLWFLGIIIAMVGLWFLGAKGDANQRLVMWVLEAALFVIAILVWFLNHREHAAKTAK